MKYTPFSNGSAACDWQDHNCDRCKRHPCAAREAIRGCRNMTKYAVELCGGTVRVQLYPPAAFAYLPARCKGFTLVGKRRDPGKNTPGLFGNETI